MPFRPRPSGARPTGTHAGTHATGAGPSGAGPSGAHAGTHATGAGPSGARPFAALALAAASLVAGAAAGAVFLRTAGDAWGAITAGGPAGPDDGILLVVALVGLVLALWVGLGMALSALSTLPGALGRACGELAARIAPTAVRKVVAFVLGTALTAALIPGTAVARTSSEVPRPAVVSSARYDVGALGSLGSMGALADAAPDASFRRLSDRLHSGSEADAAPGPSWSPERRPSSTRGHALAKAEVNRGGARRGDGGRRDAGRADAGRADVGRRDIRRTDLTVGEVVVLRGDSLWSIAAGQLGSGATTAEITAEWHRWFEANRSVIGDDADLISPGQVLSRPAVSGQGAS